MKKLFATLVLLLASVALHAQEKIEIMPAPANEGVEVVEIAPPPTAPKTNADTGRILRTIPAEAGKAPELNKDEIALLNSETGQWEVIESIGTRIPEHSLADLYMEGGYTWMTAITLCLIAMLFSTWKAPRWVKEFGLLARLLGVLYMLFGLYSVAQIVQAAGPVSFSLLCGGLRVGLIAPIYGLIVYGLSLILRLALKPRI